MSAQPILSLEEIISVIEDDIRWMASAAKSFDDIAHSMPDGERRTHLQFLAAQYHKCEEARRALIEKMRRAQGN